MNGPTPIDLVLARVEARQTQSDRWRAACPACGGNNRSALSIGVAENNSVLLHCFRSACTATEITEAIGLDLADLFADRNSHAPPLKRRRLLSAGQALDLLGDEALVVTLCACDMGHGHSIDTDTRERLLLAANRILTLRQEVRS